MIVQHNIAAMNAGRMLLITNKKKEKTIEKLSSGYRINRAADDAAGLSISEKMRRQIRGLTQAAQNAQDGISMVQIADGAMAEVHDMLHRGTELSIKAANETLTDEDRKYIQQEIEQLKDEIDCIAERTTFNERPILKGQGFPDAEINSEVIIMGKMPDWVTMGSIGHMNEEYVTREKYEITKPDGSTTIEQVNIPHEAATIDFSSFTGAQDQLEELAENGFYTTCCTCTNHYSIKFTMETSNTMETSGSHYIYNIGIGDVTNADELIERIIQGTDNGYPIPNLYVITITNYDLFGKDYMMYTVRNRCEEVPELLYDDGLQFLYFYTKGQKGGSQEIKNMLTYFQNSDSKNAVDDTTKMMDYYVKKVKNLPEVEAGYMTLGDWIDGVKEDMKEDIKEEIKEEDIKILIETLQEYVGTKEGAVRKLQEKYPDYAERAKGLVEKYWKKS